MPLGEIHRSTLKSVSSIVWVGNEEVNEMTVFAGKSDMAITLLLYPNNGANYLRLMPDCDEEDTLDRYDQFQSHA